MNKIQIFTGGTLNHIAPHLSVCAPAYGTIGSSIWLVLDLFSSCTIHTSKMGGGNAFETVDELSLLIDECIKDPAVEVIVMAAAVCDFAPEEMVSSHGTTTTFGKNTPRLSSSEAVTLRLKPESKIIDKIKLARPDIFLVTFKTTSDEDYDVLVEKSKANVERSGANICFGNDIKRKMNILYFADGTVFSDTRNNCISKLCEIINAR